MTTKEQVFFGAIASEGIAIGRPYLLKHELGEAPDFAISHKDVDVEIDRYRSALTKSRKDLKKLREDLASEGTEDAVPFIDSHMQMLEDPLITIEMEEKIKLMMRNTESVFHKVITNYKDRFFERSEGEAFLDLKDISHRILGHLRNDRDQPHIEMPEEAIVFADEVPPSFAAAAAPHQVKGYVAKRGAGNSHAALIARAKGVPFIAQFELEDLTEDVEMVIIDGYKGCVIMNPQEATLQEYTKKQSQLESRTQLLLQEDALEATTTDGCCVGLFANVGSLQDLDSNPFAYDGIGLFRSEYLFLHLGEEALSEDVQYDYYRRMVEKVEGRPIVLRVFDLGGDKHPSFLPAPPIELNPALGMRGIRFLLNHEEIFRTQLRAIHRAAMHGDIRILLPLITDEREIKQAKEIIEEVKEELSQEVLDIPDLLLGNVIEVPSAAVMCDRIASESDFLALGTNDLVQYTLGVDRCSFANSKLAYPAHPSILRLLKMVITQAEKRKIPLTICGEIASETLFSPLLLGLGLREFSATPRYLPYLRQTIRRWSLVEANALAEEVLQLGDPDEIQTRLEAARR